MENSESAAAIESTPGKRLREAREAAGMSPREMADRLNWLPSHVAAIEADRYDELRGAAFVRGYLRAYARAVELDEDELVALFVALNPDEAETAKQTASSRPTGAPSQKTGMSVVLGMTVAAIVIGAIWFKQQGADEPPERPAATPARTAPAPATAAPVAEQAAGGAETATMESPEPAVAAAATTMTSTEMPEPQAAEVNGREMEPQQSQPEPDEIATAAESPAEVADDLTPVSPVVVAAGSLQFSFSGDCWLEVRDGEGQLIYADLRRAGDTLGLDGMPPFEVLAGDAAAVTLLYQGEPVAIRTRPGRDTARFTVGEP